LKLDAMEIPHLPADDPAEAPAGGVPARAKASPRGGPILATLRHRWPEYLLEIVVIVFSISISFALDQWKERRHEHEVEQLYLKTLSNNLLSDIDTLHEVIPETRRVIQRAETLLAASKAATPPGPLDDDIRGLASRPSFFAHDAAFSDLRSSGNLRVIHDFKLKNALFDYYESYEAIKAKEAAERESLITLIAPYLIRTVSLGGDAPTDASQGVAILHDRVFVNSLWVRRHERGELLVDYERALDLAERMRRRIGREME
jgi:hypothetical protein